LQAALLTELGENELAIGVQTNAYEAGDVLVLQVLDLLDLEQQSPVDLQLGLGDALQVAPVALVRDHFGVDADVVVEGEQGNTFRLFEPLNLQQRCEMLLFNNLFRI
jgi:hypothetical protein